MNIIYKTIPIKSPFILIDEIIKIEKNNKSIYSLKNTSINEYYFNGHFPKKPIMPGSLIIENMAQTSILLISFKFKINLFLNPVYLVCINKIKFKFFVIPGDQIITKAFYINKKKNFIKFKILSFVNKRLLCSSIMIFNINNE